MYMKGLQLIYYFCLKSACEGCVGLKLQLIKNLLKALKLSQACFDLQGWHFACFLGKTLFLVEHRGQARHL